MKVQKGHKTRLNFCPQCGAKLDGASAVDKKNIKPKPGDVSVYFYCGAYLCYNSQLYLQPLSPQGYADLDNETKKTLALIAGAAFKLSLAPTTFLNHLRNP